MLADNVNPWPEWLPNLPLVQELLGFFWPIVTFQNLTLSTIGTEFSGSIPAAWTITLIEGFRNGNKGSFASYTTLYGAILQTLGMAVIAPLFLLLNLILSPIPSNPTPVITSLRSPAVIRAIPLAITTGFILPSAAMSAPLPISPKVFATLFWQAFPLWTALSVQFFASTFYSGTPNSFPPKTQLKYLRTTYAFGFALSSAAHIATLSLVLRAAFAPQIFTPAVAAALHPRAVFWPTLETTQVANIAEGALRFLKWDYAIAAAAYVLWAVRSSGGVTRTSSFSTGSVWLDVALRSVMFGPMSAALSVVWERDEVVLAGEVGKKTL